MLRFIHEENIGRYGRLLAGNDDLEKRPILLKLLADEDGKDQPLTESGRLKTQPPGL